MKKSITTFKFKCVSFDSNTEEKVKREIESLMFYNWGRNTVTVETTHEIVEAEDEKKTKS